MEIPNDNKINVSIIIPVYNVENYLRRCLESVISQSYSQLEIILVDDGSTDSSGAICDEYKQIDERITVFHISNMGLSHARNFGVDHSLSPYVFFVDSDDYLELDCIEYLVGLLKAYNTEVVCCDTYIDFPDRIEPWHQDEDDVLYLEAKTAVADMLYSEHFDDSAWNKLYKRELFQKIRFPEERKQAEEAATIYKILLSTDWIVIGKRCKYHYVQRADGLTNGQYKPQQMYMQVAGLECIEFIREKTPELLPAAERRYVYDCFWVLRRIVMTPGDYSSEINFLKREIRHYQKSVLFNKRAKRRDKIAIICLALGTGFFKKAWELYSKYLQRV